MRTSYSELSHQYRRCSFDSDLRINFDQLQSINNLGISIANPKMKNAGSCSYLAVISTSCSSPRYTRDHISIAFGDAYGNQIYAPRLDDASSGTFGSCSSDTFQIYGPCAYQRCYLYLYRSGLDGWKPESVKISAYNGRTVTFYYKTFIPRDTWYVFNLCNDAAFSYRSSYHVVALR